MTWDFEEHDHTFDDCVSLGTTDVFWQKKPEIDGINIELINLFWQLRREVPADSAIKSESIIAGIECICIEEDVGLAIIKNVDDHYRNLYAKEMKRRAKK